MINKQSLAGLLFAFLSVVLLGVTAVSAQPGLWSRGDDAALSRRPLKRTRTPDNYGTFKLDKLILNKYLKRAPEEFTASDGEATLELPMPDGASQRFRIEHSLVAEPGLIGKYPELGLTFRGYGIDDPTATVRFDLLPSGFHALILSANGTVVVDPYAVGETDNYVSYYKRDLPRLDDFKCEVGEKTLSDYLTTGAASQSNLLPDASPNLSSGTQLRIYRLALAADSEYCAAVGGTTIASCLAAQVLIMNRVNGVYERDVAIHMNIVANNNLIVYPPEQLCGGVACNSSNDPYSNTSPSTLLTQNQSNIDSVIGSSNYDIGHVFTTGGGGLASISVPCLAGGKARGETGLPTPTGDAFAIDYVAHEMGHQWGANHTFNGAVSNCSGANREASAAYEPGSGITVMGYAGICGNQDLAKHSIDTFHVKSLQEIISYSQSGSGNACAVISSTGNTPPTVSVVGGQIFNIPKQTPFALTASASDPDNDTLTYDWEEYDLGASTTSVPNSDASGAMPIFRTFSPSTNPTRTFPSLNFILNNANVPPSTYTCVSSQCLNGELLPQISRTMTFQVVARDNHPLGGGINTATASVVVDGGSGPFAITLPNTAVTYAGGSTQSVTWNVANTSSSPVGAANVKISFSSDGGNTFPTVLAASAPNNGLATVTIPNVTTTLARIKVEAVGNIFFDISDANFTVNATSATTHTMSDFDGDGKSDISVWRSTDGVWYRLSSINGSFSATQFGTAGDVIVPGDYDGDGRTDLAVWRPSTGTWYIQQSTAGFTALQFGLPTDLPAQGDFDGDGKMDIAVFRPSSGTWFIQQSTAGFVAVQFGTLGDKPVARDFDGDGKTDVAVYRPSNGTWYEQRSTAGFTAVQFGISTDKVAPADFDGDGKADPAVYRDSSGSWFILRSNLGFTGVQFGTVGDIPAPGDFDGDGSADVNVYRPTQGVWYRTNSSNSAFSGIQFGNSVDKPTPAGYVPNQ